MPPLGGGLLAQSTYALVVCVHVFLILNTYNWNLWSSLSKRKCVKLILRLFMLKFGILSSQRRLIFEGIIIE